MPQHKFKVGQIVDYHANHLGMPASLKAYTIVRQLPSDGDRPAVPHQVRGRDLRAHRQGARPRPAQRGLTWSIADSDR